MAVSAASIWESVQFARPELPYYSVVSPPLERPPQALASWRDQARTALVIGVR